MVRFTALGLMSEQRLPVRWQVFHQSGCDSDAGFEQGPERLRDPRVPRESWTQSHDVPEAVPLALRKGDVPSRPSGVPSRPTELASSSRRGWRWLDEMASENGSMDQKDRSMK